MKVTITHLKAPWPAGAGVGDVVDVGDNLPGCFVGKCTPAPDDAEAARRYERPAPPVVEDLAAPQGEDLAIAQKLLAEARAEADELRGAAERANAERDAAVAERDAAAAKVAEFEAQAASAAKRK